MTVFVAAVMAVALVGCSGERSRVADASPSTTVQDTTESLPSTQPPAPGDLPTQATPGTVVTIDSAQAAALRASDRGVVFIDVRTQDEYLTVHLVGAQNIPVDDPGLWERRTTALDLDRPTVVYCRSGSRSAAAAQMLVEQGFTEVYDLGGIGDWNEGDLPLDR